MTRHSKDDAISERQFVLLLRGARRIDNDEHAFQARLALLCAGKLGMRIGEIAHLSTDWVNQRERTIEIPAHDDCNCGYCRDRARNHVEAMDITLDEARSRVASEFDDLDDGTLDELAAQKQASLAIDFDDALDKWWRPKTDAGVREIPYDWAVRCQLAIEEFVERYDCWPHSQSTLSRRIDRAIELSDVDERIYPHALRATAASYHAARDVSAASLMAVMGWQNLGVARSYISASSEKAAKELRSKHR